MKQLIINTLISFCAFLPAQGQIINPSFTQREPDGSFVAWKKNGQIIKLDSVNAHTSPACVYMYNRDYGAITCTQSVPFNPGKYSRYKLKVFIKTESRKGYASAWVKSTDSKGHLLYYDALPGETITGKKGWKEYEVGFRTTSDVTHIEVGISLSDKGKAWFDDVSIEKLPDIDLPQSKIAEQYLGEVYNILKEQSWYADSVDLKEAYTNSLDLAAGATSTGDCYAALAYMLDRLGDRNCQFYDPATTRNWYKEQKVNDGDMLYPSATMNNGLVTIWLPGIVSLNKEVLHKYADTLHKQLAALKQKDIKGWIVDLRENVGGNATAMLAAIGPLLDKKVCGHYIRRNEILDWTYDNGQAHIDTTTITIANPYKVKDNSLPLAVLTSRQTYGAAELALIALKSRNNTRTFGEPTAGVTINEKRITLSDGALLFFRAGIISDTKGQYYRSKVHADVPIQLIYTEDHCLGLALKWMKEKQAD